MRPFYYEYSCPYEPYVYLASFHLPDSEPIKWLCSAGFVVRQFAYKYPHVLKMYLFLFCEYA